MALLEVLAQLLEHGLRPGSWLSYDHIVSVVVSFFAPYDTPAPIATSRTAIPVMTTSAERLFTFPP
jgi:hypothetical protein